MYFCPGRHNLPDAFKQILCDLSDDWHGYGLMISEPAILAGLVREITYRAGAAPLDLERAGRS